MAILLRLQVFTGILVTFFYHLLIMVLMILIVLGHRLEANRAVAHRVLQELLLRFETVILAELPVALHTGHVRSGPIHLTWRGLTQSPL